jgi:hypothetical protein
MPALEPEIDQFVMAITSDEATVRHTRAAGDDLMRKIIKRERRSYGRKLVTA